MAGVRARHRRRLRAGVDRERGRVTVTVALPVLNGGAFCSARCGRGARPGARPGGGDRRDRLRLDGRLTGGRPGARRARRGDPARSRSRTAARATGCSSSAAASTSPSSPRTRSRPGRAGSRRCSAGSRWPTTSRRRGPICRAPTRARWSGASCSTTSRASAGRASTAGRPARAGDCTSAARTAPWLRWAWERVPFRPLPYAEDQQLARDVLAHGWAKAYVPAAAVLHSHDHPPRAPLRRDFDDFRALAEVHGHREPMTPRYMAARAQGDVVADRAFMRRAGMHGAALQVATARSLSHHGARAAGPQPRLERRPPARLAPARPLAAAARDVRARRVSRPVLLATDHAPAVRLWASRGGRMKPRRALRHQPRARRSASAPSRALHERENVVFALIGGDVRHGGGGTDAALPFPASAAGAAPRRAARRLGPLPGGDRRALGPRRAPRGLRGRARGRVPFVLWATIWRHPRTAGARALLPPAAPHLPPRRRDRHLRPARQRLRARQGPRGPVFAAPQSVDGAFWAAPAAARPPRRLPGRCSRGAWSARRASSVLRHGAAGLQRRRTLVLAGDGPLGRAPRRGREVLGPREPGELRNLYAGSDVVVVPSIPTRDFLEPWGLVVNEAFHQGVPVIATTPWAPPPAGSSRTSAPASSCRAATPAALAAALRRLHADAGLRARARRGGRTAVAALHLRRVGDGMSGRWPPSEPQSGEAAASVERPMRRTSSWPCSRPARSPLRPAPPGTRTEILRDCQDDALSGQLHAERAARRPQPHPGGHRPVLRLPRRAHPGADQRQRHRHRHEQLEWRRQQLGRRHERKQRQRRRQQRQRGELRPQEQRRGPERGGARSRPQARDAEGADRPHRRGRAPGARSPSPSASDRSCRAPPPSTPGRAATACPAASS